MHQVTERALVQRINRKLAANGEVIRVMRPVRDGDRVYYEHSGLGRFHRVDTDCNGLLDGDVNIVELGRELGVLRAGESFDGLE